jgi:dipeptidyl aminopeptidase/acylaminoacyl peptidase
VQTPANEDEVRFSPDSKWIAYTSDQSGRVEVYVQGYPTPGERIQISTNGGARPLWRRDGRELFFFDGRAIAAAEIRVIAGRIESGAIRSLFPFVMLEGIAAPYDVSLDGRRFLALVPAAARGDAGFTVLTNWQTTLNFR